MKHEITLFGLLVILLNGCSTYRSPYPAASVVSTSASLEASAISCLKSHLKAKYGSAEFQILDRKPLKSENTMEVNGKVFALNEQSLEVWTIRQKDKITKHEFYTIPNGKGGHYMGFRALD